jgi:6-phosphogluconolactonase/glucosamine-6-phosphate isomerase/deaminase
MLVVLKRDQEEVGRHAAHFIANAIRRKASLTLGLATGTTMAGVYRELVRLHR